MIVVKLREAMQRYLRLTGVRHTYETLARETEISKDTLSSIGSHRHQNPGLQTIERLCVALCTTPDQLLELDPETAGEIDRALELARTEHRNG